MDYSAAVLTILLLSIQSVSANLPPVRKAISTPPVHPFHFDLLGRVEHHP